MESKSILICAMEFQSLSGAPMYHYNLGKGLIELGHQVTCVGVDVGSEIKQMLENIGCRVFRSKEDYKWGKEFYDFAIISENYPQYIEAIYADKIFNLCHSKDIADKPIQHSEITGYLVPRTQISDYWGINATVLPIPIDFERFSPKSELHDKYLILAPCARCELRKPMLLSLIGRAKANNNMEVWLVGNDYGGLNEVEIPENVKVMPATFKIEDLMAKADEVAGIFIGTVTLEAWAMGKKTSVYDEQGKWEYAEKPDDFKKHNYKNVAKQIIKLYELQ